jgi:hypothetical protein
MMSVQWTTINLSLDHTYTRNKFNVISRVAVNTTHLCHEHDSTKWQEQASKLIRWFSQEDKYSQCSFILSVLQWCHSYLIFTISWNIFSLQDINRKYDDCQSIRSIHLDRRITCVCVQHNMK